MKFLVLIKATPDSENGVMPSAALLTAMMTFNEELVSSGMLLDGAGLRPSRDGVRIELDGTKRSVTDGPFTETKELVAGYWLLQAKSRDEVVAWMKRCPCEPGQAGTIEIRPLYEMEDLHAPDEVVAAAERLRTRGALR